MSGREQEISRSKAGNYRYVTHTAIVSTSTLREFHMKETPLALHLKVLPSSPLGGASVNLWWTLLLLGCSCSYSGRTAAYSPPMLCGEDQMFYQGLISYPIFHPISGYTFWHNYIVFKELLTTCMFFYSCIYTYDIYLTTYKNRLAL